MMICLIQIIIWLVFISKHLYKFLQIILILFSMTTDLFSWTISIFQL